jgi:hypothetical protein
MVSVTRRLLLLALLLPALSAIAQSAGRESEVRIKAAFLYKFGDFVEWPPNALERSGASFTIGVLGADDIAAELERVVAERTIKGRPVSVRRIRRGDSLANLHVLFVGRSESLRLGEIMGATDGQPVLTVTETENALASGSMINFIAVDDKVRFDVALAPAGRGQLKISARLLAVARKVVAA